MSEAMDWNYLIGRIFFSLIFLASGFNHFANVDDMTGYAQSRGLPAPKLGVLVSGAMILAGGLSVLLGVYMEIGLWLLAIFLLAAAFTIHAFWKMDDPQAQSEQAQFMKNLALAGACMALYWTVQTHGYGPFTLGSPMG